MAGRIQAVGLNALYLDPGVSGGTETYVRELAPALMRAFPDVRFAVVTTRRGARALRDAGWDDVHELPADDDERMRRTVAELGLLPRLARRLRLDVVHSLANRGPVALPAASVVTVHDVIFFQHRTLSAFSSLGMQQATRWAARRADAVVTASDAAADDIVATLGIARDAIAVVPHGMGSSPGVAPAPADEVRRRLDLPDGARVVLCVAVKRPHKNQELLVRALAHLPPDVVVVCVGHDEGYGERLRELAQEGGVADRLRLPGRLPGDELEALWGVAACAALPTRQEGFGLPALEAMRRRVPVACSDIPVLREVAGDAAHYFDPADPRSAARAIEAALAAGGAAVDAAERRAGAFTWDAAARGTFEAYEHAMARRGTR